MLRCVCRSSTRTCVNGYARSHMSTCACLRSCAGVNFCSHFLAPSVVSCFRYFCCSFLSPEEFTSCVASSLDDTGRTGSLHISPGRVAGGGEGKWEGGGRKGEPSPKGKRGLNRKGFLSSIFFLFRSSSSSSLLSVPPHNPCAIARPDGCDEAPTASDFQEEAG